MNDLYKFLKQLSVEAGNEGELLLSYALVGWLQSQPPSSTEGMADIRGILQQYALGNNGKVNAKVNQCRDFIEEWFDSAFSQR